MTKFKNSILFFLFIACVSKLNAQSYIGHAADNYAGVHSLIYNPSNIVDSNFRTDINIFSASAFGGSDYFGIDLGDILNTDRGFDLETDANKFPSNSNNFFLNVDILGPSFMFNIDAKNSIGLVSRIRAFSNVNNINGELYESLTNDFDTNTDFSFNSNDLTETIHAWAEVGIVYGRVLINEQENFLKGGITLKYLQGAGSQFSRTPNFTGQYNTTNETLTTTGNLIYGTTQGFDSDDINFDNLSSGFGSDIGFTYEYRPTTPQDSASTKQTYKLKIGASITDIGTINYSESTVTNYNLNNTVNTGSFDEDTQDFLDNNYLNTQTIGDEKIKLPTAFHFLADYNINNKFYVSLQSDLSLINSSTSNANSIINAVTLAPRFETKWFSFYSPISLRQYGDFAWGGGIRLGPLMVGSSSVFSNLISNTSKTTDVFVGLKIPIYKK